MAYRKRRRRRGGSVTIDATAVREPASDDTATETKDVDDRVPVGQRDLPPEGADADDLEAVHKEAIDRYEQAWEKERDNQRSAYDDLRFLSEEEAQWDGKALQDRRDQQRPILTVNKIPQFIRQVTGDIRQLRPSIHVVPVDEKASDNLAVDILPEMVRYIERRSDAKGAYFSAADQMVGAGIGHVRVFTEYAAGTTMNQEIAIGLIQDGIAVLWDCDSIHLTRKDSNYCFVPIDMNRKAAELRWPKKSFNAPLLNHECWQGWYTDEFVRVTEYWRKTPVEKEIAVYPDGKVVDLSDDVYDPYEDSDDVGYEGDIPYDQSQEYGPDQQDKPDKEDAEYRPAEGEQACANCTMFQGPSHCTAIQDPVRPNMLCNYFEPARLLGGGANVIPFPPRPPLGPHMGPKRADAIAGNARIEKRDSYVIERFVMSATEILEEPDEWPGMEIPIIPFLGEEIKIGRQTIRRGVVRPLKDVQRLYNYAISADAEAVALQPKSPFKGTRKNFDNFRDQWETANSRNWPYLEYDPDPLNNGRPPEREPPPVASSGIKELLGVASADMSAVTGIYPSSLGAPAQETSGRAIVARQREGDTGTFVYIESFGRAIERIGQIIVDLIPHVYDTERTLRVVGDDGKMSQITINKQEIDPNGDGIATKLTNDVTLGAYQVSVEMGPSYSTKREEARDGMQTLMQTLGPQAAPLLADLFVQGQDFPLADRIGERMKLLLPPQVAAQEAQKSGQPPPPQPPPPPPDPEAQIKGAELELKKQEIQSKALLQQQQQQLDGKKLELELYKVNVELEKARMAAQSSMVAHAAKAHQTGMDMADADAQRMHEANIATIDGASQMGSAMASATPLSDEDQQKQIDALIEAVTQLQKAVGQIAQAAASNGGGGAPRPPGPPPGPAPGPPPPPPPGLDEFVQPPPPQGPPGGPPPGAPPQGPGGPLGS